MPVHPTLPDWIAIPLFFAAAHAIVVLVSALLLCTPFAAVGLLAYQVAIMADSAVLSFYWDGEIATLLTLGSLQWAVCGLLAAAISRLTGLKKRQ